MDRAIPDATTEDERTNQISTASAVIGTPTEGDDVIDGGFLLASLNGLAGTDFLQLDYSGLDDIGRSATSVEAKTEQISGRTRYRVNVGLDDDSVQTFFLEQFERVELIGSGGNDTLQSAGPLSDTLIGRTGDDTFYPNSGGDIVEAGFGNDTIYWGGASSSNIDGGSGLDTLNTMNLSSLTEDLVLTPGTGVNIETNDGTKITGVEIFDNLSFGSGNDILEGGFLLGRSFYGGPGTDLFKLDFSQVDFLDRSAISVEARTEQVSGRTRHTVDVELNDGTSQSLIFEQFERVELIGSGGNDILQSVGSLSDVLIGLTGDDTFFPNSGGDIVKAGFGDDTIYWGGALTGEMDGGLGLDTINTMNLSALDEKLVLRPGTGINIETTNGLMVENIEIFDNPSFGSGDDILDGGFLLGRSFYGGSGTDLFKLDFSQVDFLDRSAASVEAKAEQVSGRTRHTVDVELNDGTSQSLIFEQFEAAEIVGTSGNDFLQGLGGDDLLHGGSGNDSLDGQEGGDTYRFGASWGVDTITDPDATGKLVFDGVAESTLSFNNVNGNLVITDGANQVTFNRYYVNNYAYDVEYTNAPPPTLPATLFRHPLGAGDITAANDGDGYYIEQSFDVPNSGVGGSYHLGVDWNGEGGGDTDLGYPVYAIANGVVVDAVTDQGSSTSGFGNYVVVRHDLAEATIIDGRSVTRVNSLYAHLARLIHDGVCGGLADVA